MAKKATPVEVQAERNQATLDYHSEQDAIHVFLADLSCGRWREIRSSAISPCAPAALFPWPRL